MQHSQKERRWCTWWGWVLGLGCGLVVAAMVILYLAFLRVGTDVAEEIHRMVHSEPLPAAQRQYVGVWKGSNGSRLTIRNNATADCETRKVGIQGGHIDIDVARRTLRVKLLRFEERWRIDKVPQTRGGVTVMVLDGERFRRLRQAAP